MLLEIHTMASGLSRRCIGALWSQPSVGLALAGSSRLAVWDKDVCAIHSRRYTTPAARKTSSTAKGTRKTAALKSASTQKVSTKSSAATTQAAPAAKGARKNETTSASSNAVSHVSTPEPQLHTTPSVPDKNHTKFNRTSGGMAYKVPEKEENKALTEEEQIAQVDQIMAMSKLFPTADPWGQRVDTLGGSSMVNCRSPWITLIFWPHKKRRNDTSFCQTKRSQKLPES